MAKFWKHLMYHEDTVLKREITSDEIRFLSDLQKEMNTQDTVGQADPRYWVIRDHQRIYGSEFCNADGVRVYIDSDKMYEISYSADNYNKEIIKNVKQYILENYTGYDDDLFETSDVFEYTDLKDVLEEYGIEIVFTEYLEIPTYSGFFLTQKAAEEHLRKNHYHYGDQATTFAMTAWRNPEVEKLYRILHEVDFDKLKTMIEEN